VTAADSGSPDTGVPSSGGATRAPRARTGSIWVLMGIAALVLAAPVVFVAQNAGESQVSFLTLHDRRAITIALLAVATAGWLFTFGLIAVRVLQSRRIARRQRLENLATAWMAASLPTPGARPTEPRLSDGAGEPPSSHRTTTVTPPATARSPGSRRPRRAAGRRQRWSAGA
jgi:uncharacterized integral membrane protein